MNSLGSPTAYTLSVAKAGTGTGTVTSSPSGINCGSDCSESYASGTSVTLTAAPSAGHTFSGWSGACTGSTSSCMVSMNTAKSVTATFTQTPQATLSIANVGLGSGTVTRSGGAIHCGNTCTETLATGSLVTLTATPAVGSTFGGGVVAHVRAQVHVLSRLVHPPLLQHALTQPQGVKLSLPCWKLISPALRAQYYITQSIFQQAQRTWKSRSAAAPAMLISMSSSENFPQLLRMTAGPTMLAIMNSAVFRCQ